MRLFKNRLMKFNIMVIKIQDDIEEVLVRTTQDQHMTKIEQTLRNRRQEIFVGMPEKQNKHTGELLKENESGE